MSIASLPVDDPPSKYLWSVTVFGYGFIFRRRQRPKTGARGWERNWYTNPRTGQRWLIFSEYDGRRWVLTVMPPNPETRKWRKRMAFMNKARQEARERDPVRMIEHLVRLEMAGDGLNDVQSEQLRTALRECCRPRVTSLTFSWMVFCIAANAIVGILLASYVYGGRWQPAAIIAHFAFSIGLLAGWLFAARSR